MLLDWKNPPLLAAPRRKVIRALNADRIKLVQLKASRAKGPKKHATNKERSYADRAKARDTALLIAVRDKLREEHKAKVRAYWAGELDAFPK
jgi:hypothetical protein